MTAEELQALTSQAPSCLTELREIQAELIALACPKCGVITADDEGEHLPAESPYPGLPFRVFLQRVKLQNDVSEAIHGCRHDQAWQPLYAEYGLPDD